VLAFALAPNAAMALPSPGTARPDAMLIDGWDRRSSLAQWNGKPLLVVYEDKTSSKHNAALKADLSRLAKGDRYRNVIALAAIADVSEYDFWPARGFVKDAIREESRKENVIIYCDWDGSVRQQLDLRRHASNVVLYGKDGRVLYSRAGILTPEERAELLRLLRAQVEAAPGG
jgi:predicted transcriptional regulator